MPVNLIANMAKGMDISHLSCDEKGFVYKAFGRRVKGLYGMNQDKIHQHTIQFQRIINKALRESYLPALALSYDEIRKIVLSAENLSSISKVNFINREISKIIDANITPAWGKITNDRRILPFTSQTMRLDYWRLPQRLQLRHPLKLRLLTM